ncbi:hypothetical protein C0J52_02147 [Blattella germanica]|nr:hypothetical protein C0J52_02147 [Blattella germanica]
MKNLQGGIILVLALILGVNSAVSKFDLVERAKHMPRELLLAELRTYLSPAFRSALDDSVIAFLDTTVRDIIKNGYEEWGVPVLDPLSIEHLDLDLNFDQIKIAGTVDGAGVTGIAGFVVDLIKTNLLQLNVDFGVHVPEIHLTAEHYDIDGELGGLIPVYGNGSLEVFLRGLNITGKITIGTNNSYIYVRQLDLDASFVELETHIEGLLGGGELSDLINEVIADIAPDVFEEAKPTLIPILSEAVVSLANEKLDGMTLQDLLNLINGGSKKQ